MKGYLQAIPVITFRFYTIDTVIITIQMCLVNFVYKIIICKLAILIFKTGSADY